MASEVHVKNPVFQHPSLSLAGVASAPHIKGLTPPVSPSSAEKAKINQTQKRSSLSASTAMMLNEAAELRRKEEEKEREKEKEDRKEQKAKDKEEKREKEKDAKQKEKEERKEKAKDKEERKEKKKKKKTSKSRNSGKNVSGRAVTKYLTEAFKRSASDDSQAKKSSPDHHRELYRSDSLEKWDNTHSEPASTSTSFISSPRINIITDNETYAHPSPHTHAHSHIIPVAIIGPSNSFSSSSSSLGVDSRNIINQSTPEKEKPSGGERARSSSGTVPRRDDEVTTFNPIYKPRSDLTYFFATHSFAPLSAMCEVMDPRDFEDFSQHLYALFQPNPQQLLSLMKWSIRFELHATARVEHLFRSVDIPTKLLSMYLRREGGVFVRLSLNATIKRVLEMTDSVEVDPLKLVPGEDLKANQERLAALTQHLLEDLIIFSDKFASSVQAVFEYLRKHFKAFENLIFGALFFLRFLSPALVSPDGYGLITETPTPQVRRRLILISKVLQNLANGVNFGDKEGFMSDMNPFIEKNQHIIRELHDRLLTKRPQRKKDTAGGPLTIDEDLGYAQEDPIEFLNHFITVNRIKLASRLPKYMKPGQEGKIEHLNHHMRTSSNFRINIRESLHEELESKTKNLKEKLDSAPTSPTLQKTQSLYSERGGLFTSTSSIHLDLGGLDSSRISLHRAATARGTATPPCAETLAEPEAVLIEIKLEAEINKRKALELKIQQLNNRLRQEVKEKRELMERLSKYEPVNKRDSLGSENNSDSNSSPRKERKLSNRQLGRVAKGGTLGSLSRESIDDRRDLSSSFDRKSSM